MKTEAVTAETNLNGTKERKLPIPKDAGRILAGALALSLADRINVKNALINSINVEFKEMEIKFDEAKKLIGG